MEAGEISRPMAEDAAAWEAIKPLTPEASVELLQILVRRYGFDEEKIWWWSDELPHVDRATLPADDHGKALRQIFSTAETIFFAPTDEMPSPWLVYETSLETLIAFMSDCRFFEYLVTNVAKDTVALEDHHFTVHVLKIRETADA